MASLRILLFLFFLLYLLLHPGMLMVLASSPRTLQFNNTTFKIALFADLHYGEAQDQTWGPAQDINSSRVMSHVLDAEHPNLVIYLGDVLTANNMISPNATMYWEQALSPTLQRGIPWASLFGNHDDMAYEWPMQYFDISGVPGVTQMKTYCQGTTRAELMTNEMSHLQSLSMDGPQTLWPSVSNYAIQITSSGSSSPAVILYFLPGGGSYPELISASQVSWFNALAAQLNPTQSIPELAFWHIPSQTYAKVAPAPAGAAIKSPCVGTINLESVAPQTAELGFMKALSARNSMKATFVGHNHGLDWCCPYGSMHLCFARHTGYGGYGNWARGARVLEMVEKPFGVTSHIRLEDGTISGMVKLV